MRARNPKRYLLIQADGRLTPQELETLTRMLEQRHGRLGLTALEAPGTSLIVKTDRQGAEDIRASLAGAKFGDKSVATVLTSGNIGKLKRRVQGSFARDHGQVHER
jgi:hypothetical protein